MTKIRFDVSKAEKFISKEEIKSLAPFIGQAHDILHGGTGEGSDFLGWVKLPEDYDREEYDRIKKAAAKIRSNRRRLSLSESADHISVQEWQSRWFITIFIISIRTRAAALRRFSLRETA